MSITTVLIVPAWSDQASQCKIVAANGRIMDALASYRRDAFIWKEVGIMNSAGKLVCLEEIGDLRQQMADCAPLMAGLTFYVDEA